MKNNLPVLYGAQRYDEYTRSYIKPYDEAIFRSLYQAYNDHGATGMLLDVGTGTAQLLIQLALSAAFPGLTFAGLDLFEDMVQVAQRNVRAQGLADRVMIVQGDVHALPFAAESADFLLSRSTIHHWADPVRAFHELYRVLKHGGVGIIHDLRRDPDPGVLAEFNHQRAKVGIGPTNIGEKYTVSEVRTILHQAGIAEHCTIIAPESGLGALGFELRISKGSNG